MQTSLFRVRRLKSEWELDYHRVNDTPQALFADGAKCPTTDSTQCL